MSNEPTTEMMNRAICEFMGWEFRPDGDDWFKAYHDGQLMWAASGKELNKILLEGFKFHEDWNKLMPVVGKIHNLAVAGDAINAITEEAIFTFSIFAPLKDVHRAVYQFITWYNQQKTNQ